MSSMNRATLIGNLARDPESRSMNNGSKVVNLTLVTNERWKDASGEQKERAEFHRVVIFNDKLGEIAEKYLRKGSRAMVEGSIQSRKYTDKDGQERQTTEIVLGRFNGNLLLLDKRSDDAAPAPEPAPRQQRQNAAPARHDDLDDSIPF